MQRETPATKSGSSKAHLAAPEVTLESASVWAGKSADTAGRAKGPESPVTAPPVWTRYIDSRLKQFCTR
jgi:hypothetical protein